MLRYVQSLATVTVHCDASATTFKDTYCMLLHLFSANSTNINIDHIRPGPYTACFRSVTCLTLLIFSPLGH